MGLVCWRQPSRSGPRPVLAELKNRGSWGAERGREPGTGGPGAGHPRELPPQPRYLQAAVVALGDLVEGDVQERDLVVAQDFIAAEDLGWGGRVRGVGTGRVCPPSVSLPGLSRAASSGGREGHGRCHSRSRCPRSCPRIWSRCRWRTWAGRSTAGRAPGSWSPRDAHPGAPSPATRRERDRVPPCPLLTVYSAGTPRHAGITGWHRGGKEGEVRPGHGWPRSAVRPRPRARVSPVMV